VQESDIKKQFYGLKGLSNFKKFGVDTVINNLSFKNTAYTISTLYFVMIRIEK
jgi:hypothetical protein